VLGIDGEHFEDALEAAKQAKGTTDDLDLDAADLRKPWSRRTRRSSRARGPRVPAGPARADGPGDPPSSTPGTPTGPSSTGAGAHPGDLGTAVNICSMVFGNLGPTRAPASRSPATRRPAQGVYGDYLQNAQGEDVVAGIRNTVPLATREIDKKSYDELMRIMSQAREPLPRPVRHRVHHRARQALDAADPGGQADRGGRVPHRDPARRRGPDRQDEAIQRVTGAQLAQLMFPRSTSRRPEAQIAKGMNASPGAAVGKACSTRTPRSSGRARASDVILVRRETNPTTSTA
jgi:pyruvate,orthophosphate dikinase